MEHKEKTGKKPFRLQEHVEWIAVAFVLALTVRCFVVEAYRIPTGSMAPTLYGSHLTVTCPACGTKYVVGYQDNAYPYVFVCPTCEADATAGDARFSSAAGDRILVSKNLYLFSSPRRWEVFVFKSPKEENMNFVKRLVGLPGERLELKDGQVFINGRIAAKPLGLQKKLWQDVYDESRGNGYGSDGDWNAAGSWKAVAEGLLLADAPADWQTVEYARRIDDFYPYNGHEGDNLVSDILVSGHARLDGAYGSFAAAVWADSRTVRAVFTPNGQTLDVELRINEEPVERREIEFLGHEFDFSLASVDGRTVVEVGGKPLIERVEELTPDDVPDFTSANGVFFQGRGAQMLVSGVRVKRDIYYRKTAAPWRPDSMVNGPAVWDVPEGSYFAMGDNSPVSNDSRAWNYIPEGNVLGKAFFLFWPPTRVRPVY